MAQVLLKTPDGTSVPAAETLRELKTKAEEALQMTFASGCLIDPNRRLLDTYSVDHALHHFRGQLVKKFLRALRHTKRKLAQLERLLESLVGDGDPGNDKLAAWTNYQPDLTNTSVSTSPGEILNRDLNLVHACLDMVRKRRFMVTNLQSTTPRALVPTQQLVTIDNFLQFLHPQRESHSAWLRWLTEVKSMMEEEYKRMQQQLQAEPHSEWLK